MPIRCSRCVLGEFNWYVYRSPAVPLRTHWNINGSDLAQRWCAYVHGVCGALAVGISLGAWRLEAGARTRRIGARGCRARLVCPRLRIAITPARTAQTQAVRAGVYRREIRATAARNTAGAIPIATGLSGQAARLCAGARPARPLCCLLGALCATNNVNHSWNPLNR